MDDKSSLINPGIPYLPVNAYFNIAVLLKEYAKLILISYSDFVHDVRSTIIRNFISRSVVSINGLLELWKTEDYHDCWIIFRAIIDRYLYLESLGKHDSFDQFDTWCFIKKYEYKKRCLSDPKVKEKISNLEYFSISPEEEQRYSEIDKQIFKWKTPKAFDVANILDLEFLYHYGYDFGSLYVHPNATEGQEDFTRLTNIEAGQIDDNQITVIHNSFLIVGAIIGSGLKYSRLEWIKPVLDFLNNLLSYLAGGPDRLIYDIIPIRDMNRRRIHLCRIPH